MRSKILILSILVASLFIVNSVYAAFTVSVSLPSKSLNENDQATVTVTVTNPSGGSTESSIVTTLSSSTSWFSVVTDCTNINSLSAGQTGTSTCIIKPTSTGNDLGLTATSTSQGSTTGSGSTSGISVASSSSSLTASISADSSVATSATFYVGITVTAPSANDVVNARATISASGQCTVDTSYVPAQQSLGNITKGTSKSPTNWKLTSTASSGTCSITVNVVSDVGGTAAQTKSITVGSGGGGGSSGTGSSGSGLTGFSVLLTLTGEPKVTTEKGRALITGLVVAVGKSTTVDLDKTEDIAFREITIYAAKAISNAQVIVTKLADKPADITQEVTGRVYHFIQVDKNVSDSDIDKTVIKFEVEKSWVNLNNIDSSTIALYRYSNNSWNKLQTTKASESGEAITYEATSPGLSIFAVSGEGKVTLPGEQPASGQPNAISGIQEIAKGYWKIIIIGVGLILAVALLIYFSKKNQAPRKKNQAIIPKS